jgi:hypothetical protein
MPTVNGSEAICPECRVNQVEAPFDYCSMCEMLTLYYREKLATPEQLQDQTLFRQAYESWRDALTWRQIETLRDQYWTTTKQRRVKAARRARS